MKPRRQDFVLGIAVLALLALFVGTVLFIYPSLGVETRQITVRFRHEEGVAPLKPGSPVMLSGALQVGKVSDVRKQRATIQTGAGPREDLLIVVDAEVDADLELFDNCQITTDQPPVGGGGVLVILNVGKPSAGAAVSPIEGLPPQSLAAAIGTLSRRLLGPNGLVDRLEQLIDVNVEGSLAFKVARSLDDVNAMTQDVRLQLNPHEQTALMAKVHAIFDNLNETTAALRGQLAVDDEATLLAKVHIVLDQLEGGLAEANAMLHENRPAIRDTLTSIESVTRQMDEELLAAFKAELNRDDPTALLGKIHAGIDRLNVSLENVVTMTDTGRKLVVLNRPALQRSIDNLKDVSDELRVGVQEIMLAPWRLFRPPAGEIKRLDVFEAARRFAEAASMLDDAATRLQAVLAAGPAEGQVLGSPEEIRMIQDSLQSAFERFQTAEDYLWEQMK
jgi:ABC-type transporter Mla subunit MlaD